MITKREQSTLQFIQKYMHANGEAPLLSEIASGIGISSKGVIHRYLTRLTEMGYIQRGGSRHRGISLCKSPLFNSKQPPSDFDGAGTDVAIGLCRMPLLGEIAAGRPIEAIEGKDYVDMSEFFVGPDRFVLRVVGDSMCEAGILHGDMVVIQQRDTAENGQIVVALLDMQNATLKYYRNNGDGTISLRPANNAMPELRYNADRVSIQGVVVAQLRSYL